MSMWCWIIWYCSVVERNLLQAYRVASVAVDRGKRDPSSANCTYCTDSFRGFSVSVDTTEHSGENQSMVIPVLIVSVTTLIRQSVKTYCTLSSASCCSFCFLAASTLRSAALFMIACNNNECNVALLRSTTHAMILSFWSNFAGH